MMISNLDVKRRKRDEPEDTLSRTRCRLGNLSERVDTSSKKQEAVRFP